MSVYLSVCLSVTFGGGGGGGGTDEGYGEGGQERGGQWGGGMDNKDGALGRGDFYDGNDGIPWWTYFSRATRVTLLV